MGKLVSHEMFCALGIVSKGKKEILFLFWSISTDATF